MLGCGGRQARTSASLQHGSTPGHWHEPFAESHGLRASIPPMTMMGLDQGCLNKPVKRALVGYAIAQGLDSAPASFHITV